MKRITYNPGDPLPKFQIGDRVEQIDTGRKGRIVFVGDYDDYIEQYRYVIRVDGGPHRQNWNENNLKKIGEEKAMKRIVAGRDVKIIVEADFIMSGGVSVYEVLRDLEAKANEVVGLTNVKAEMTPESYESLGLGTVKLMRTAGFKEDLIAEGYEIDENNVIRSPGRYEAEWFPVVYFYEAVMNGDFGIMDFDWGEGETTVIFEISKEDMDEVPELAEVGLTIGDKVAVETTSQGFISLKTHISDEQIAHLEWEYEDYMKEMEGEGEGAGYI